jgi:hypothetical protein
MSSLIRSEPTRTAYHPPLVGLAIFGKENLHTEQVSLSPSTQPFMDGIPTASQFILRNSKSLMKKSILFEKYQHFKLEYEFLLFI